MASTKVFDTYPPFPQDVPTAKIARLSLSKLAAEDGDEASALFEACCSSGFFLLDLQNNPTGESLQQDIEKIFHVAKETMALEVEEKARFKQHPPADLLGQVVQTSWPLLLSAENVGNQVDHKQLQVVRLSQN